MSARLVAYESEASTVKDGASALGGEWSPSLTRGLVFEDAQGEEFLNEKKTRTREGLEVVKGLQVAASGAVRCMGKRSGMEARCGSGGGCSLRP